MAIHVLILMGVFLFSIFVNAQICMSETYQYEESKAELLAPERGFYKFFHPNKYGYPEYFDLASNRDFTWARKNGFSLIAARVSLAQYRYSDLPETFLKQIQDGLDAVRAGGIKVILRFNYNNGNERGADSTLPWMLRHISQLGNILHNNADVIAVIQAGFLGAWGEWHSSTHGLDTDEARQAVIEALLNSLPKDRSVQVRTPQFKEKLYGPPLLEAAAYTGSNSSRVGHHNDCLFASENDFTYPLDKIEYYTEYVAKDTLFVPIGGETCKKYPPRTNCVTAQSVMKKLHYSYLNNDYSQEVIGDWKAEGCYEEIALHLGYRLVIRDATFDQTATAGSVISVEASIENIGWAAPFNPRALIVSLGSPDGGLVKTELEPDARRLQSGKITKFGGKLQLPPDIKSGNYTLYLSAPDPAPRLSTRYEYAIPFANEGYQFTEARLSLGQITVVGHRLRPPQSFQIIQ